MNKPQPYATYLATLLLAAFFPLAINASTANLLFVVDESGSMGGEHDFLQSQAPSIETGLNTVGVTDLNFGLVGYGNSDRVPRLLEMNEDGDIFGDANDFTGAASQLATSGGFEDGYAAIDFALNNYNELNGPTFVILVTDEDRDILDDSEYPGASTLTTGSIQQALGDQGARLVSILDQEILNAESVAALALNSENQVYTADDAGGADRTEDGTLGSDADGDTTADYALLALDTGGVVADLNELREGGLIADSFTLAFIDSLVSIILIETGGDLLELAENENQLAVAGAILSTIGEDEFTQNILRLSEDQKRLLLRLAELQGMRQIGNTLIKGAQTYTFVMDDHYNITSRHSKRLRASEQGDNGDYRKWNGFVQAVVNDANISSTSSTVSGDSDNHGGLAGVDYRWSPSLVTGVALGYKDDEIDYSNQSNADIETASIMAYASWMAFDSFSVEGSVGYAQSDIETFRRTSIVGATSDARGDTDADTFSASIGARYARNFGNVMFTPYTRLQWANVDVDGFDESGGGALAATVSGYDVDSIQGVLGLQVASEVPVADYTLRPFFGAEYIHEFEDDGTFVDTVLNDQELRLKTDSPESDYGRLSVGSALELSERSEIVMTLTQSVSNDFIDTTSFRLSFHHAF
ncbi:MAG: autotransporter domain-containing protein [Opitutales bacterium]